MNYQNAKVQQVKVSDLKANPMNPRQDVSFGHIDGVKEDGIRKAILVGTSNTIYQGHLRTLSALHFGLDTIPAIVIDDSKLSIEDKLNLLIDHSSEKALNKAEAYLACCEYFHLGYGEADVCRRCICILNTAFNAPASSKLAEAKREAEIDGKDVETAMSQAYFKKHRGTLQNMARLSALPNYVGEAYMDKWNGISDTITQKDVKTLYDSFKESRKGNEAEVNAENPPKGFKQEFEAVQEVNAKNDGDTETKVKMQTKADIEKMLESAKNADVIAALKWVLGTGNDASFRKMAVAK